MPICLEIITEEDLHLYADGQLQAARRQEVGSYLWQDDEAFQRVEAYRWQNAELHRLLCEAMSEPVPERLRTVVRSAVSQTQSAVVASERDTWVDAIQHR